MMSALIAAYEFLRGLNHTQLAALYTVGLLVLGIIYALVEKTCEVLASTWRDATTTESADAPALSEAD